MRLLLALFLALSVSAACVLAAEKLPPAPTAYCTDEAGFLSPGARTRIDSILEENERATSNQLLVVIYPKMESDSSMEDYTVRLAQSWHVGQKGKDNGAVLFVFVAEHQMRIEVGYGLEGALTDALCRRIIGDVIAPRLRQGDKDGAIEAGAQALVAASRGEYKGDGATAVDQKEKDQSALSFFIFIVVLVLVFFLRMRGGGAYYGASGFGLGYGLGRMSGGGGGWGGGGGFSGGGGGFGGGGAGGGW